VAQESNPQSSVKLDQDGTNYQAWKMATEFALQSYQMLGKWSVRRSNPEVPAGGYQQRLKKKEQAVWDTANRLAKRLIYHIHSHCCVDDHFPKYRQCKDHSTGTFGLG